MGDAGRQDRAGQPQIRVNDFGSTMMEENVVSAAGTSHTDAMTLREMQRLIKDAGYAPIRRNTRYEIVKQKRS